MANEQIARNYAQTILAGTQEVMFGLQNVIQLILIALYTSGHVLLEGNPGLGKTALVKKLSEELGLPSGRIQFTPDLLPSDIITRVEFLSDDAGHTDLSKPKFTFGPVFTSLLLADEINRATPKTQSAMLQAMAEREVTFIDGKNIKINGYNYDEQSGRGTGNPFMVLATQNPVEHEGTFNLPEAQLDRFMFKIVMPTPSTTTLLRIMKKEAGELSSKIPESPIVSVTPESVHRMTPEVRYWRFRDLVRGTRAIEEVETHISRLFMATNAAQDRRSLRELTGALRYGLGPRAAKDLLLGAKGWRLFFGDNGDEMAQAGDLAMVILPVLRHRLKVEQRFLKDRYEKDATTQPERWMDRYIRDLAYECAPNNDGYRGRFDKALSGILGQPSY